MIAFSQIGRRGNIKGGPGVTILDASGKFAIPGLIDAHVHFDQSANIYARPDAVDLRGSVRIRMKSRGPRSDCRKPWCDTFARVLPASWIWADPCGAFDLRDSANGQTAAHRSRQRAL